MSSLPVFCHTRHGLPATATPRQFPSESTHATAKRPPCNSGRWRCQAATSLRAALTVQGVRYIPQSHTPTRHETPDVVHVGPLLDVPHDRLPDRIAGIVDDGLRRHLPPFA